MSKFKDKLKALGFENYEEYLASPHWQDFKERYRDSVRRQHCAVCCGKPVQLHHHTYERLGAEELSDVIPLCRDHHTSVHEWLKANYRGNVHRTEEAVAHLRGEPKKVVVSATPHAGNRKYLKHLAQFDAEFRHLSDDMQISSILTKLSTFSLTKKQRGFVRAFTNRRQIWKLFLMLENARVKSKPVPIAVRKSPFPKSKTAPRRRRYEDFTMGLPTDEQIDLLRAQIMKIKPSRSEHLAANQQTNARNPWGLFLVLDQMQKVRRKAAHHAAKKKQAPPPACCFWCVCGNNRKKDKPTCKKCERKPQTQFANPRI